MAGTTDNRGEVKRTVTRAFELVCSKCDVIESKLECIALIQTTLDGCLEKVESAAALEAKLDQLTSMQTVLSRKLETVGSAVFEMKSVCVESRRPIRNGRKQIEFHKGTHAAGDFANNHKDRGVRYSTPDLGEPKRDRRPIYVDTPISKSSASSLINSVGVSKTFDKQFQTPSGLDGTLYEKYSETKNILLQNVVENHTCQEIGKRLFLSRLV